MSFSPGPWGQVPQAPAPQRDRRRDAFFLSLLVVPLIAACVIGLVAAIIEEPERRADRERQQATEQAQRVAEAQAFAQRAAANASFNGEAVQRFMQAQGVYEYRSAALEADGILVVRLMAASMERGLDVCNWLLMHSTSPARSYRRVEVKALDDVVLAGGFQGGVCVRGDAPLLQQMGAR